MEKKEDKSNGGKISEEKLKSILARLKRPKNTTEETRTTEVSLSARVSEVNGKITRVSNSTMKANWKNNGTMEWVVETEAWMEEEEEEQDEEEQEHEQDPFM